MESKEQTSQAKSPKGPKNRRVTVIVKAHELYPLLPTEHNVDAKTALEDDEGFSSRYGESNKNFETGVFMDYKMKWDIEVAYKNGADRGYDVELVSIEHNPTPNNPNFFTKEPSYPGNSKKTMEGTITNSPLLPDMDDSYTINFRIIHNGVPKPFPLDPKLRVIT